MSDIDCEIIHVNEWDFGKFGAETERRVRDLDIATRLQMPRPRDIRPLIKRHWVDLSKFGEIVPRDTVSRGRNQHGETRAKITVKEYWLNERQALFIASQSGTKQGHEITVSLINAFYALRSIASAALLEFRASVAKIDAIDLRLLRIEAKQTGPGFIDADQAKDIRDRINAIAQMRTARDPSLVLRSEK